MDEVGNSLNGRIWVLRSAFQKVLNSKLARQPTSLDYDLQENLKATPLILSPSRTHQDLLDSSHLIPHEVFGANTQEVLSRACLPVCRLLQ